MCLSLPVLVLADTERTLVEDISHAETQRFSDAANDSARLGCTLQIAPQALGLLDALVMALCTQKDTAKAWSQIAVMTAQLGAARADFWPTLTASAAGGYDHNKSTVPTDAFDNSNTQAKHYGYSLDLNWKLYDFGVTYNRSQSAKFALLSAIASKDSAVQRVALEASQAFFDALSAEAQLQAATEAESYAHESMVYTKARFTAGIIDVTDQLQAQTAFASARIKRISAEGDHRSVIGTLCVTIGRPVDCIIELDHSDAATPRADSFSSIDELMREAMRDNPALAAARATAESAAANYDAVSAEGHPTISLVASSQSRTQRSVSANNFVSFLSLPPDNLTTDRVIELRVSFPLFTGFAHKNRVLEARGLANQAATELEDEERQLSLLVWKAFQSLRTASENYDASQEFVQNAKDFHTASLERYCAGVGTVIDMLSAQSALASAETQRISALANWRNAKLQLAAAVGRLTH